MREGAGVAAVNDGRGLLIGALERPGEGVDRAGRTFCTLLPAGVEQQRDERPRELPGPRWYRLDPVEADGQPAPWVGTYLAYMRSLAAGAGVDLDDVVWLDEPGGRR